MERELFLSKETFEKVSSENFTEGGGGSAWTQ